MSRSRPGGTIIGVTFADVVAAIAAKPLPRKYCFKVAMGKIQSIRWGSQFEVEIPLAHRVLHALNKRPRACRRAPRAPFMPAWRRRRTRRVGWRACRSSVRAAGGPGRARLGGGAVWAGLDWAGQAWTQRGRPGLGEARMGPGWIGWTVDGGSTWMPVGLDCGRRCAARGWTVWAGLGSGCAAAGV